MRPALGATLIILGGCFSESSEVDSIGADATTAALECTDHSFADVYVPPQPVNLYIVVLPDTDLTTFNAAAGGSLDGLVESEDLRVLSLDPDGALVEVATDDPCFECGPSPDSCNVLHVVDPELAPLEVLPFAPMLFPCLLHPQDVRERVLVLSGNPDVDAALLDQLQMFADTMGREIDIDLLCPGCGPSGASALEQVVAARGGIVGDLDNPNDFGTVLYLAGSAPPSCTWPAGDAIESPLSVDDLKISIDSCGDPECVLELTQVSGLGTCSGDAAGGFFVLADLFGAGISGVSLCPIDCAVLRRAAVAFMDVQHDYVCPG